MPHKIFGKNAKNNDKKIKKQRASSVLSSKRTSSKFKIYKKKEKNEKNTNIKNKENRGLSGKTKKSISRTNSSNKVNLRPNSEYIFNKIKSNSIYNQA